HRSRIVFDGFRGVRLPTYDRVDGLTLGVGAGILTPPVGPIEPLLRGWVEYRFERGEFTGGGEASATRGRTTLAVGAERTTATERAGRRRATSARVGPRAAPGHPPRRGGGGGTPPPPARGGGGGGGGRRRGGGGAPQGRGLLLPAAGGGGPPPPRAGPGGGGG